MKVHCGVLGIWLLLAADFSRAGPPFVTDDPEPPPPGGWEINVPLILERTPGKTDMDTPLFDLNYGLPEIQLKLEFPIEIVNEDNNGTQAGAGDSLIGVKWRFFNNKRSQFQLGTYPQVLVPTGNHSRGLGEGSVAFLLPFLAQKNWEKWTLYGNIGYWWQGAHETRNYFYEGAVIEREINEQLELGVELFGNSPKEHGVQCRGHMEVDQASQPALFRWTRHRRRHTCDGLHRIAVHYEMNTNSISICAAKTNR
jgi:hypothetical protein